jgi:hypothetical protein
VRLLSRLRTIKGITYEELEEEFGEEVKDSLKAKIKEYAK